MAEKVLPKYLRQTTTGRIYAYAAELAKRKDMVPVAEEAPNPELKIHAELKNRHGEGNGKGVQISAKQPAGRKEGNAPEGGEGEKGSA